MISPSISPAALLSFTIVHYVLALAAVVLFYVYYTLPDDCTEHKVFISLNLIFCLVVSIVAILPKVQVTSKAPRAFSTVPMTLFICDLLIQSSS